MLGGKQRVGKPGVIDLSDLQIAGLLQNFRQSAHVVAVRMGNEPCLHLVAQRGEKPFQEKRLVLHASVHYDQTPPVGLQHVGIADRIDLRRKLPQREARLSFSRSPALARQSGRENGRDGAPEQRDAQKISSFHIAYRFRLT